MPIPTRLQLTKKVIPCTHGFDLHRVITWGIGVTDPKESAAAMMQQITLDAYSSTNQGRRLPVAQRCLCRSQIKTVDIIGDFQIIFNIDATTVLWLVLLFFIYTFMSIIGGIIDESRGDNLSFAPTVINIREPLIEFKNILSALKIYE